MRIERDENHERMIDELPDGTEVRATRLHGDSVWWIETQDGRRIKFYGTKERVWTAMREVNLPDVTWECPECDYVLVKNPRKAAGLNCPKCNVALKRDEQ